MHERGEKIPLTNYEWIYGIAQLAAAFLSVIAGILAVNLFNSSKKQKLLRAWRYLMIALVIFAVEEVVCALKTFGVYSTPHLTHVIPSVILAFLIAAVVVQININKGWLE